MDGDNGSSSPASYIRLVSLRCVRTISAARRYSDQGARGRIIIDGMRGGIWCTGSPPDREVHLLQHGQGGMHGDAAEARQHQARHHVHRYVYVLLIAVLL
jgi:hypothetical protein